MKQSLLFLVSCVVLASCSKKKSDDKEAPVVTLTAPANNQSFPAGEIHIKGNITDNEYISQVHIEITNFNTGAEYTHIHIHPTSKSYAFDQPFTLLPGISYKIRVIADDPAANTSSSQVQISCN